MVGRLVLTLLVLAGAPVSVFKPIELGVEFGALPLEADVRYRAEGSSSLPGS